MLYATRADVIGLINIIAIAQKNADAVLLTIVIRRAEVVIKVAVQRGIPRNRFVPLHAFAVLLELF